MRRTLMAGAVAAATAAVVAVPTAASAHAARTYTVTKSTDDGSAGTLRWAIGQANAGSGGDRIELSPKAGIIRLTAVLPALTKPMTIAGDGASQGKLKTGIDGSAFVDTSTTASCPGWASGDGPNVRSITDPGLSVIDGGHVTISNLIVRNFCIGLLSVRSHDNLFESNLL